MNETVEDPVCHKQVSSTSFATIYAGIHYAFCSDQCKDRFLAHPHVYVGCYGQEAPSQQRKVVIKRHRISLSEPLDAGRMEQVKGALLEMPGVQEVCIDGNRIEIQYDLIQVALDQIADKLTLVGANLGGGWLDRLKLALINDLEEIEINSLEVTRPTITILVHKDKL